MSNSASIREEISARLQELDTEAARLRQALAALDGERARPANGGRRSRSTARRGAAGSTNGRSRTKASARVSSKRAPRGANQEAILRSIREQPRTGGEIAKATGVGNATYGVLRKLVTDGRVEKREEEGRSVYALVSAA